MPLADAGKCVQSLRPQQLSAQKTMHEVIGISVAENGGRMGEEYADIVEHCPVFQNIGIQMQLGVGGAYLQGSPAYLPAVGEEQVFQIVVLGIVFVNDEKGIHGRVLCAGKSRWKCFLLPYPYAKVMKLVPLRRVILPECLINFYV